MSRVPGPPSPGDLHELLVGVLGVDRGVLGGGGHEERLGERHHHGEELVHGVPGVVVEAGGAGP